jgi:hypothetical protein
MTGRKNLWNRIKFLISSLTGVYPEEAEGFRTGFGTIKLVYLILFRTGLQ